jgi:hypothetical protein
LKMSFDAPKFKFSWGPVCLIFSFVPCASIPNFVLKRPFSL